MKTKKFSKIMEELKERDPEFHNEIKTEVQAEIEELKKHGGYRPGAGRKKLFKDPVKATFRMEKDTKKLLDDYAKEHNIKINEAVELAIKKLVS